MLREKSLTQTRAFQLESFFRSVVEVLSDVDDLFWQTLSETDLNMTLRNRLQISSFAELMRVFKFIAPWPMAKFLNHDFLRSRTETVTGGGFLEAIHCISFSPGSLSRSWRTCRPKKMQEIYSFLSGLASRIKTRSASRSGQLHWRLNQQAQESTDSEDSCIAISFGGRVWSWIDGPWTPCKETDIKVRKKILRTRECFTHKVPQSPYRSEPRLGYHHCHPRVDYFHCYDDPIM